MEKSSTLSPVKQALLEQRLKGVSHARISGREIPKRPNRDSAPLSFTQHQVWVIDQLTPGNPAYNLPYGYRLRGPLNLTALEDSFNAIIKRHDSLRTTFAIKDGEPLQLIHPTLAIKINVTALDHLTGEERENRLQALASEESVKSFDLSCLPLIRVSLFKLGDAEHVLIINLHHVVADGLSIGLMLDELDTFIGSSLAVVIRGHPSWLCSMATLPCGNVKSSRMKPLMPNRSSSGGRSWVAGFPCWRCLVIDPDRPSSPSTAQMSFSVSPPR